jgi:hypothetical protein
VKRKTVRFQCTAGPMIEVYIQELLSRGMFGDTRAEVVRRMMCNGIMEALPGETIQRLVKMHNDNPGAKHE